MAAVLAMLLLDYVRTPLRYQWIPSYARPVDAALRADPDDVVVLEWPLNRPDVDVDAKLRTVGHGKRVVNGFAGFMPDFQRGLSGILSETSPPLESSAARTAVARIYPLRYLVVRGGDLAPEVRPAWRALRETPPGFLRFRSSHGEDDLYEIVPLPERGLVLERVVAYDLLVSRPVLRARLRPVRTRVGVEQWVAVRLNETPLIRAGLDDRTTLSVAVAGPLRRAAPNLISIQHGYRRGAAAVSAAHRIGTTGVTSPIDALVRSGGQPYGDVASIRVGVAELAPNRRGYNLVALDSSGDFRDRAAFDTLGDPTAAGRLVAWVRALPAGTVVLGAVKDEASG